MTMRQATSLIHPSAWKGYSANYFAQKRRTLRSSHSPGRTPIGLALLDRDYAHSSWRALSPRERE